MGNVWDERAKTYEGAAWVTDPTLLDWTSRIVCGLPSRHAVERGAVIDVGCGTGALTEALWQRASFSRVVGFDPSEGMLAVARERRPAARVGGFSLDYVGGPEAWDVVPSGFDVAVARGVLHLVPDADLDAWIAKMKRLASPGGWIVLCEGVPPGDGDSPEVNGYDLFADAREIVSPGAFVWTAKAIVDLLLGAGCVEVAAHERFTENNSCREWLASKNLLPAVAERAIARHREALNEPLTVADYQLRGTEDGDVIMRWRHAVVCGRLP